MGEWDALVDERSAERNKQLERIADAIEGQNKVLANMWAKALAISIVDDLKKEDKDYELRNGTGEKVYVTEDTSLVPKTNSFGPPEDAKKVEIPKGKEMTITIELNRLSDSGLAYNFTWKEGDRTIWLPKSLVDNMNKEFQPLLNQVQAIKVPTNIMRDK